MTFAVTWAVWAVAALQAPAAAVPGVEARREAVVVTAVENMYSGPDATRDVVSQALLGQVVGVVETADGFARIETPDRYRGWVPAGALFTYADRAPRYARSGAVAEITSLMANVYRDPDVTTARPKAHAPLGARLEGAAAALPPGASAERWLAVRLPSGETGYVQRGDVRVVDASAPRARGTGADIVATARRFLGAPYLWGGMSPLGVDCSGLVSRAYAVNGIDLLRDADIQFSDPRAVAVEKADLQAGDLIFFGGKKITHVGVHAGGGRFIHATTHLQPVVQESALDDPHWTALYRGARRMPAAAAAR
jgi:cell wall-associated NlpC family hydrolase